LEENFPFERFFKISSKDSNELDETKMSKDPDTRDLMPQEQIISIGENILKQMESTVGEQKFNTYFRSTFSLSKMENNKLHFFASTPFIESMIEMHHQTDLENAVKAVLGDGYKISIDVNQSNQSLSSNTNSILNKFKPSETSNQNRNTNGIADNFRKAANAKEAKFTLDLTPSQEDLFDQVESKYINHMDEDHSSLDPNKTFKNFIVGSSNNLAYSSALAAASSPGQDYQSLYFHGDSGLGKTHLLHAIGNEIKNKFPTLKINLVTARDFVSEFVTAIQKGKVTEFHSKFTQKVDVLLIDDIHELKNKQGTQNEFFHVFNELHRRNKQLVFTSDQHPKEILGLEERIKTRLSWGLVLDIQKPDLETRIAILKKKALDEDIFLTDDVINLIASSCTDSIRELEGSLIRLAAYSSLFNVDIDIEIAKQQLKINKNVEGPVQSLESIVSAVSQKFRIPVSDIRSKARNKQIAQARHVAMFLCYEHLNITLSEIGQFFSGRDHSSVIHAIDKIKRSKSENTQLFETISDIETKIK
jgi:chromosomal replication initiator protein